MSHQKPKPRLLPPENCLQMPWSNCRDKEDTTSCVLCNAVSRRMPPLSPDWAFLPPNNFRNFCARAESPNSCVALWAQRWAVEVRPASELEVAGTKLLLEEEDFSITEREAALETKLLPVCVYHKPLGWICTKSIRKKSFNNCAHAYAVA